MFRITPLLAASAIVLMTVASAFAEKKPHVAKRAKIVATDIATAGPDFAVQGEYVGTAKDGDKKVTVGVQVVALGDGKFHAVGYVGGLPGDGWDEKTRVEADGQTKDGGITFIFNKEDTVTIRDGVLTLNGSKGKTLGALKKTIRTSPTLGEKPPAGAIVLFNGTSAGAFVEGRVRDGLLLEGATTKQKFQSFKIHLEFMIPFMPTTPPGDRGNSGFYAQGRYEAQIIDSFGMVPHKGDCAAIYGIMPPRINMCYPPLSWQTFDIDYTAAHYQGGKKVKNARFTVRHNDVEVQKDAEATHATTSAPFQEGPETSPLYFQDHGDPVRFRNIWLMEKK